MRLNDPTTWLETDTVIEIDEHPQLGQVRVSQWLDLHFYRAPGHPVNLILALKNESHVKRSAVSTLVVGLGGRTNSTQAKLFGLSIYDVLEWIIGNGKAKQRLHWTLPNLRTPEQSERWSDLMPLMSWQLWLARDLVLEHRLPWQSARIDLTPGRVAQSMLSVLVDIGTPTKPPKHRGKSPGWETGKVRTKAPRYPTVKKRVSRRKKSSRLVV
ncbi:hypothetical protein [Microcoleus sp. B7-D4]